MMQVTLFVVLAVFLSWRVLATKVDAKCPSASPAAQTGDA